MHDRAGGHRGLPTAISALVGEGFGLQQPGPAAAATRTDKPFRPPALEKVHRTRAFRRKAVLKFDQRPRKPSLRSRYHPTPRSSRYRGAAYSLVLVLYTKSRSTGRSCIGRKARIGTEKFTSWGGRTEYPIYDNLGTDLLLLPSQTLRSVIEFYEYDSWIRDLVLNMASASF